MKANEVHFTSYSALFALWTVGDFFEGFFRESELPKTLRWRDEAGIRKPQTSDSNV